MREALQNDRYMADNSVKGSGSRLSSPLLRFNRSKAAPGNLHDFFHHIPPFNPVDFRRSNDFH